MQRKHDVLVALGGPSFAESQQRANHLARLYELGLADYAIVTGAYWGFGHGDKPANSMGKRMGEYLISKNIPSNRIIVADQCVDTIGDALAVKTIMEEEGWLRAGLTTTDSHMSRSMDIFTHALGEAFTIEPYNAGAFPKRKGQWVYERLGGMLCNAVLAGTEPGDDEAIKYRLHALVPGYTEASKADIAFNHLRRLAGVSLVIGQPLESVH